ncbi:MAG TPA: hypothetical protein VGF40_09370, partial [Thermoanaerobaculia bacterium]
AVPAHGVRRFPIGAVKRTAHSVRRQGALVWRAPDERAGRPHHIGAPNCLRIAGGEGDRDPALGGIVHPITDDQCG